MKKYIVIIALIFSHCELLSQTAVEDLFDGKKYWVVYEQENFNKILTDSDIDAPQHPLAKDDDLYIDYLQLSPRNKTLDIKELNKKMKYWSIGYTLTDSFRINLAKSGQKILDTQTQYQYEHQPSDIVFDPNLARGTTELLYIFDGLMCLQTDYIYKARLYNQNELTEFLYRTYTYLSLKNGQIYTIENLFLKSAIPELNQKLTTQFKNKVKTIYQKQLLEEAALIKKRAESEYDEYDDYDSFITNILPKTEVTVNDFTCLITPNLFRMMYHPPADSPFGKLPANLNISFEIEKIKKYINPKGPISSLLQLKPKNEIYHSINIYQEQYDKGSGYPYSNLYFQSLFSPFKKAQTDKLKAVKIYKRNNPSQSVIEESKLIYSYEFNSKGLLVKENAPYYDQTLIYQYDIFGKLSKIHSQTDMGKDTLSFMYDSLRNLKSYEEKGFKGHCLHTYQFYGDQVYEQVHGIRIENDYEDYFENFMIYKINQAGKIIYSDNITSTYDAQNKLLSQKGDNIDEFYYRVFCYNNLGQILSSETNSSGTYYTYDQKDRLTEELRLDNQGATYKFSYIENTNLIDEIIVNEKYDYQNQKQTFLFKYEYWK